MALPRLLRVASFRLAALYVVVFAVSAAILGVIVFLQARSALEHQTTARIENEVSLLTKEYRARGLTRLLEAIGEGGQRARTLEYLVESPSGVRVAGNMPNLAGLKPGWTTMAVPQHSTEDPDDNEQLLVLARELNGGVLLAVGESQEPVEDLEEAIARALLWTVGIAGALGIVGGAAVSRAFLRRVDTIARTADAIFAGDLMRRVPLRGTGDDFDRLAATLNRMLDRIAVLMESLRQVSADVAHDLRTPLTRLYHRLEEARSHARSPPDYQASVNAALAEAQALLETFAALLRIAQVEGGSPRSAFTHLNLSTLVQTAAEAYRPDAEESGHRLISKIAPDLFVTGDQELLTQAIANLIENALCHTPSGTQITVGLHADSQARVVLSVEDNGPGVDETELPRLTDRFYRGQRSRTAPGNGLGLSLVDAIAELHGARLCLSAGPPGFRAAIVVPNRSDARGRMRVIASR